MDGSGTDLAEIVGPFWSVKRTATALRIDAVGLSNLARRGGVLLVMTRDGHALFPEWQFIGTGRGVEVHPMLLPLFRSLARFDPWAVALVAVSPAPELGELTPLRWVTEGRDDSAIEDLGRRIAAEWSS